MRQESNLTYQLMVWTYRLRDAFGKPGAVLNEFGIKPGDTVVDSGCGPGRHLGAARTLVGGEGTVYAVDIHPAAVAIVAKIAAKQGMQNVHPVLLRAGRTGIADGAADLVYALDMFHQVDEPGPTLAEIRRITKDGGRFILEDGHKHQSRETTRRKLSLSNLWRIECENERYLTLRPTAPATGA